MVGHRYSRPHPLFRFFYKIQFATSPCVECLFRPGFARPWLNFTDVSFPAFSITWLWAIDLTRVSKILAHGWVVDHHLVLGHRRATSCNMFVA